MKALLFNEKGPAEVVLQYAEIGEPHLLPRTIKVKMLASAINPADFMFIEKQYRLQPQYPQIAGFEGTGIIADNGGDENFPKNSLVAFRHQNAWAEFVVVPKTKIVLLPQDFPVEKAAQLSLNPLTAWALLEEVNAKPKEWILLSAGNSAVSKLVIQFAKNRNVRTIPIVRDKSQIDELLSLGASAVLVSTDDSIKQQIKAIIGDNKIAAFLDAVGGNLASEIIKIISPGSTILHYGLLSEQNISYHSSDVIFKNLLMKGFGIDAWLLFKSDAEIKETWKTIIKQVSETSFKMNVAGKFLLKNYKQAIRESKDLKNGKILFWMSETPML